MSGFGTYLDNIHAVDQIYNEPKIHISLHKRDARKYITTVQGLPEDSLKKILSSVKKKSGRWRKHK